MVFLEGHIAEKEEELEEINKKLERLYFRASYYLGEMGRKLNELARKTNRSKSEILREALEEYFSRHGYL